MVDHVSGRIAALHLPGYDPAVSDVAWLLDYAANCGVNSDGRPLYAVVAQIAARKPLLNKNLREWNPSDHTSPACPRPPGNGNPSALPSSQLEAPR
jgi:hypothetical protein